MTAGPAIVGVSIPARAAAVLADEIDALTTRLDRLEPFELRTPMLPAASPSSEVLLAMREHLRREARRLHARAVALRAWLLGPGALAPAEEMQHRYSLLRLAFNATLSEVDLFADALVQRSESETGTWLAGLDVVADDALAMPGRYTNPPLVCYLDRGIGAAIRRVRTRLPGGSENPVAIIRVPRERMVGAGIAGSLIHEVGHQAAALLDLVPTVIPALRGVPPLWTRWISEILSDLWSVSRVGITATRGLMNVVSLPRVFMFHLPTDDPHPGPWIRVHTSLALGAALYPDPQWDDLRRFWNEVYPLEHARPALRRANAAMLRSLPAFVEALLAAPVPKLGGARLGDALASPVRAPAALRALRPRALARPLGLRPTLLFAAVGQARHEGRIDAKTESDLLTRALVRWGVARAEHTARRAVGGTVPPKPTPWSDT